MTLLSRFNIRTKLASMVVLSALAVCAIIALSASLSQRRMLEDRVAQMRAAVDILVGMAQTLQDQVAAGNLTLAEAQSQYRQCGKGMLFDNGQGYPLTYNPDTSFLLNGTNPALEGKITYSKDADGELIAPKIMAAALQSPDGGTASYFFPRPGQTVPVRKMFFARKFAPFT